MKLKNVIIVNDYDYVQGGASKVAIDTANLLDDKGYNVIFFSGATEDVHALNSSVKRVSTGQGEALADGNRLRGMLNGMYNRFASSRLAELLSEYDPAETVVHIHGWTKCLSSSVFNAAFKRNFPVVVTLHDYFTACPNGGFFNYNTNSICHLDPMSMSCITTNCDSRNYAFKLYRVARQFVQNRVIYRNLSKLNFIYISDLSWEILRSKLGGANSVAKIYNPVKKYNNGSASKKKDYFLYVGRMDQGKGLELFCKAASELNVNAIVVGDGEPRNMLAKQYPDVEFVGWQPEKVVRQYMQDAKALVFPSIWYEGMSLVVVEASQDQTFAIVSDSTSSREIIIDGQNGTLFKSGDAEDLKKKMDSVSSDNSNSYKGTDEVKNIMKLFSYESYYTSLIRYYEKVLEKQ